MPFTMCHGAKSNPDATLDKTPIKQLTVPTSRHFFIFSLFAFPNPSPFPNYPYPIPSPLTSSRPPLVATPSSAPPLPSSLHRRWRHLTFSSSRRHPPPTRLGRDGHGSLAATDLALGVATDMELGVTDLASPLLTHRHRLRRRFASFASSSRRSLPTKAV